MPNRDYNLFGMPYYRRWDNYTLPDLSESIKVVEPKPQIQPKQLIPSKDTEPEPELTYEDVFDFS